MAAIPGMTTDSATEAPSGEAQDRVWIWFANNGNIRYAVTRFRLHCRER